MAEKRRLRESCAAARFGFTKDAFDCRACQMPMKQERFRVILSKDRVCDRDSHFNT